jgi:hypothetical protein
MREIRTSGLMRGRVSPPYSTGKRAFDKQLKAHELFYNFLFIFEKRKNVKIKGITFFYKFSKEIFNKD